MKSTLLFLFSTILLISCEEGYVVKDHKVVLKGWNEGSGSTEREVEGADPATFETFSNRSSMQIGRDKEHVFIGTSMIEHMDPATLKEVGEYYFSDDDSVYFFGSFSDLNNCEIQGVNPQSFDHYEIYPWAHDKQFIVYEHNAVAVDNVNDFLPLNESWGKTKNKILYQGTVLDSADYQSFEIIDVNRARDRYHTYEYGQITR